MEELAAANSHAAVHKLAVQIKTLDVRLEQFADAKPCIQYYGRTAWKPIYEHVKTMKAMQNNRLHLHGTLWAGKSYLLAGLVCQLQREGVRVVYP